MTVPRYFRVNHSRLSLLPHFDVKGIENKPIELSNDRLRMLHLFTDGSAHAQSKVGYGAYLVLPSLDNSLEAAAIQTKRFENTSSTKLELQTLLWALSEIQPTPQTILKIYTDSTAIANLPARRAKLEAANYYSKNGKRLNNYNLYQQFYDAIDCINYIFEKVKGHQPNRQKTNIDKLFSQIDKAARQALRAEKH